MKSDSILAYMGIFVLEKCDGVSEKHGFPQICYNERHHNNYGMFLHLKNNAWNSITYTTVELVNMDAYNKKKFVSPMKYQESITEFHDDNKVSTIVNELISLNRLLFQQTYFK